MTQGNLLERFRHVMEQAYQVRLFEKGDQDWHSFLASRGIRVQGVPIPGHEPKGFVAKLGDQWVIFVDNSVPLSCQSMTVAHEFAHLHLCHQPQSETEAAIIQELEAEFAAMVLSYPNVVGEWDPYWRENPEIQKLAVLSLIGVGAYLLSGFLEKLWIMGQNTQ